LFQSALEVALTFFSSSIAAGQFFSAICARAGARRSDLPGVATTSAAGAAAAAKSVAAKAIVRRTARAMTVSSGRSEEG
jgi:hypothetical protein